MAKARNDKGGRASSDVMVAVDTGGTFTDVIALVGGALLVLKVPSTPHDPSIAVLDGVQRILDDIGGRFVLTHGSTVATNALLERKGARVALITNRGFEDVLEIGRQNRPQLYVLAGWRKPPLVDREHRIGVAGRLGPAGDVLESLDAQELSALNHKLAGVDSVAVCLLHAYANPDHEIEIAAALAGGSKPVSLSHEVLAEYREYERCSTTVVNAYVAPIMQRYLSKLEQSGAARVRIMGSSGGTLPLRHAQEQPVHTVLSGPAGGVVGALAVAARAGTDRIVTFDMGGTSTDVSICPGRVLHTRAFAVDGMPVAVPVMDIHTVGAGGGSIAWIDAGGALRVGPQSAGAAPGPICYGRGGTEVTVTDAQVWLNRLPPAAFLGGTAQLDREAIRGPLQKLAKQLGVSADEAAEGVVEVINTAMEGALRVITVERGFDPLDFTLVPFGGAAGLHAVELAVRLGVPRILLPQNPGLLSAYGMLVSPVRRDAARTVLIRSDSPRAKQLDRVFRELERSVTVAMKEEGLSSAQIRLIREVDARYHGQSFELRVPAENWVDAFHEAHRQRYGYNAPGGVVEAVTARVTAESVERKRERKRAVKVSAGRVSASIEPVRWDGRRVKARVHARESLSNSQAIVGPAVITEYSSTTWLPPGWRARVDSNGNLLLTAVGTRRAAGGAATKRTPRGSK